MKREVIADVMAGNVPASVADYSELHDYVDANYYGGAFDGDFEIEDTDYWNAAQTAISQWIEAGGLRDMDQFVLPSCHRCGRNQHEARVNGEGRADGVIDGLPAVVILCCDPPIVRR